MLQKQFSKLFPSSIVSLMETQYFCLLSLLCFFAVLECRRHDHNPKYDVTDGCIFDQYDYYEGIDIKSTWTERLPGQTTVYDKFGNVAVRVHYWLHTGCHMVIEKCRWKGDACVAGSGQKWKFGGCEWSMNETCVPKKCVPGTQCGWEHGWTHNNDLWRRGSWVPFTYGCGALREHDYTP